MKIDHYTNWLEQQSRAVYLCTVLAVVVGVLAYVNLASGIYPEVTFPRVVVLVEAGDVAAQNLLPSVTRPIEEAVSKIPGFKQVRTLTLRGFVETSVEFTNQTDIELALQQVRGRVGELRATFPTNSVVTIERLMPSVFPVLSYNLSAQNMSIAALTEFGIYQIRPRLLQIPGVAQVKVQSAQSREISVEIDPERLAALQMNLSQVATAIQQTNQVSVIGRSQQQHQQALILGTGELFNADEFKKVVISSRGGLPVQLGQIAEIHEGSNDIVTAFNGNGRPAVLLSIIKQPNANLVQLTNAVNATLPAILQDLPKGVRIQPVYNLADLVTASIENLRDAILLGILLIVAVLYVFLRDWRSTIVAAGTIPVTIAITCAAMFAGHQTLNLMSLGGLAVAVGLVIDDAIVVIEGVFHNLQSGLTPEIAVTKAVDSLGAPVISSTLTTIVVFAPLGLLEGVVGQFFAALSFTLSASVIISLLLALTITPVVCSKFLRTKTTESTHEGRERRIDPLLTLLDKVLAKPKWAVVSCAVLVLSVFPLSQLLQTGFMPDIDEGSFVLDYFAPPGTSLSDTDHIAQQIEDVLAHTPDVRNWSRRTGARLALAAAETSRGDILVRLNPSAQRHRSTTEVMDDVRTRLKQQLPGIDIELTQILQDLINDLADSPAPVAVKIFGNDPEMLKTLSIRIGDILGSVKGLVDINLRIRPSATEDTVRVDPAAAAKFGMTVGDVLTQVQIGLLGITPTYVREQEKLIPVRVRFSDSRRLSFSSDLATMPIFNASGNMVLLGSLAQITPRPGNLEIRRENLARLGLVTARLEKRDLGSAMNEVQKKISSLPLPFGYHIAYGGQWASQQTAFLNLSLVLALGVLLVYLVLVVQFRSLVTPLPILLSVPISLFGVFLGLIITRTSLNISSFMGIILLVGLVVKNGIILLTYAEDRITHGDSVQRALHEAVLLRVRPILMTTVCTLLGLLPLALGIGAGSELQKPLAVAVISGLSLSTLTTLLATPAMFKLLRKP